MNTYPLIVNLILEKDNKILMLYRKNTPSYNNLYALPAGKVEKGESLKQNIIREAYEEVGITLQPKDLKLAVTLSANYTYNEKSIEDLGFFFIASKYSGDIKNIEPHKHDHLKWIDLNKLPDNTLSFTKMALEAYKRGENYIELGFDN